MGKFGRLLDCYWFLLRRASNANAKSKAVNTLLRRVTNRSMRDGL